MPEPGTGKIWEGREADPVLKGLRKRLEGARGSLVNGRPLLLQHLESQIYRREAKGEVDVRLRSPD